MLKSEFNIGREYQISSLRSARCASLAVTTSSQNTTKSGSVRIIDLQSVRQSANIRNALNSRIAAFDVKKTICGRGSTKPWILVSEASNEQFNLKCNEDALL